MCSPEIQEGLYLRDVDKDQEELRNSNAVSVSSGSWLIFFFMAEGKEEYFSCQKCMNLGNCFSKELRSHDLPRAKCN